MSHLASTAPTQPYTFAQLDSERITLQAYSLNWRKRYVRERNRLAQVLEPNCIESVSLDYEHIGSTAVRGMVAKPIIDIMIGVTVDDSNANTFDHVVQGLVNSLSGSGYDYFREYEQRVPHRKFLIRRWRNGERAFHVSVVATHGVFWTDHIRFRNELRASPTLASEYARLKRNLLNNCRDDRNAYVAAKTPFVHRCLGSNLAAESLS